MMKKGTAIGIIMLAGIVAACTPEEYLAACRDSEGLVIPFTLNVGDIVESKLYQNDMRLQVVTPLKGSDKDCTNVTTVVQAMGPHGVYAFYNVKYDTLRLVESAAD